MKKFLFQSAIGVFFGAFLAVIITIVIYIKGATMLDGSIFVKNALALMLCGWFFSVTPLFFELKSIRLPIQTVLHFTTVAIIYIILSIGIGWIPFKLGSILLFIGLFIVIYAAIWTGFYFYFKNEAKKLNDDLLRI